MSLIPFAKQIIDEAKQTEELKPMVEELVAEIDKLLNHDTFSCFCNMPRESLPELRNFLSVLGVHRSQLDVLMTTMEDRETYRCVFVDDFLNEVIKTLKLNLNSEEDYWD